MMTRRQAILSAASTLAASTILKPAQGAEPESPARDQATRPATAPQGYTPVVTPNGTTLPWEMDGDVKVFRLTAEPVKREFAPGMIVNCWGYNGQTPGPTIEAVEGDRVRIYLTNKLPEPTTIHWHGVIL